MGTKIRVIGATEAIDSSGEILVLEGLDISDLEIGKGVFNFEHNNDAADDVVGKITLAKKIFKEKDCENESQLKFWKHAKGPYLYLEGELFDDVGHHGAAAIAAMLRYSIKNNEPMMVGASIEGSTLERDGMYLKKTIAKRCALTLKPCNKQCIADMIKEDETIKKAMGSDSYRPLAKGYELDLSESFLESIVELEKARKDDYHKALGGSPEHLPAAELAANTPNKNWGDWIVKNYKANPKALTPEIKTKIEHFGSMKHLPEVDKFRFDNSHSFESGLQALSQAESQGLSRAVKGKIQPTSKTKKLLDVGNGMAWYDLGTGACKDEGGAMGHCGNVPSESTDDKILSLRRSTNIGGKEYHEPVATFIENKGYLGEMKGKENYKPHPKYHQAIAALLKHPRIKGIVGGGYLPQANFHLNDLDPKIKDEILTAKSNIDSPFIEDLPGKFQEEDYQLPPEIRTRESGRPITDIFKEHATLASDEDPDVRQALARNPSLHPEHQRILARDKNRDVRRTITHNPSLHPDVQKILASDEDPDVRRWLARNPSLHPEHQRTLASDEDPDVRRWLAQNHSLHPEHQRTLSNNKDGDIRYHLAGNPSLHPEHQRILARDKNRDVRQSLADNPSLHPEHWNMAEEILGGISPSAKLNSLDNKKLVQLTGIDEESSNTERQNAQKAFSILKQRNHDHLHNHRLTEKGDIHDLLILKDSHNPEVREKARKELDRRASIQKSENPIEVLKEFLQLTKSLAAGQASAPGFSTQGSALTASEAKTLLEKEFTPKEQEDHKDIWTLRNRIKAALRNKEPHESPVDVIKSQLSNLGPKFKDHFTSLIDDITLTKNYNDVATHKSTVTHIPHTKEQKHLVAGIRVSKPDSQSVKTMNSSGNRVLVRRGFNTQDDAMSTSEKATVYHNLAHNFFGLGEHVPNTAAYINPIDKKIHHAIQFLPQVKYGSAHKGEHYDDILKANKDKLHKIAIMDYVLGNSDRHLDNLKLGKDNNIYLTDNESAFSKEPNKPDYLHLLDDTHHQLDHSTLNWVDQMDPKELVKVGFYNGTPKHKIKDAANRLIKAKALLAQRGNIKDLWNDQ